MCIRDSDKPMWGVDGRVRKIVQTDTAIYLGGSFNNLLGPNGEVLPRSNAAALDPVTGEPLPFAPNPNNAVWAMALSPDGSSLYLGGDFTKVAGVNRKRLAKVNATTGAVSTWRVDANSQVQAIATRHDTVYVGGEFTLLGTTPRTRLAALDAATGAVSTTWLASADAMVHDLEFSVDGSRLFAGGLFTSVSGSLGNTQRRLTSLNPVTGTFQPWTSHPGYEVFDVEATRTQVFAAAGGSGGHTMGYDGSTGALQWSAFSDGDAVGVELQNGVLYAGGHFTKWNGLAASHLIALNPAMRRHRPQVDELGRQLELSTRTVHTAEMLLRQSRVSVPTVSAACTPRSRSKPVRLRIWWPQHSATAASV